MKKNKQVKSKKQSSVKGCSKSNVKSYKNNSKKITGFEDSKSFELDKDNDDSFELK